VYNSVYNYLTDQKDEVAEDRNPSPAPGVTFFKITAVGRTAVGKSEVLWEHGAWRKTAGGNINHSQIMLRVPCLKTKNEIVKHSVDGVLHLGLTDNGKHNRIPLILSKTVP
jgi:hypothetical protein